MKSNEITRQFEAQMQSLEAYRTQFFAFTQANKWFNEDIATGLWPALVGPDIKAATEALGFWQSLSNGLARKPRFTVLYRWSAARSRGFADYEAHVVDPGASRDFGPQYARLRVFENLKTSDFKFVRTDTGLEVMIDHPSELLVQGRRFGQPPTHSDEPTILASKGPVVAEARPAPILNAIGASSPIAEQDALMRFYHADDLRQIKIEDSIKDGDINVKFLYLQAQLAPDGPQDAA